eukprot:CAMPEP_0194724822 /NCGR_PEP_ID=MMETSP0296-20130528/23563_1 /TAXON_ID=39354 /ORGANISM="Heterosigma akashiwo, Strain CCMP2393" /LENGTH=604 /DNA_ID=CAMNT_0039628993 /DNA_START=212 /DNA_END=2026 /DNA_ORIENTATION=-
MGVKDPSKIRNFSIIAHIDHGKSTLADRLLEITDTVQSRDMQSQLLDSMDIERERGITIKLQAARMEYTALDGESYVLNLIDTPGHVDFTYEVSRSLAACEGAILVVDASQGVEAQTLANVYLALENDLEVIPVLNKIDLPAADPDRVSEEVEQTVGLDCTDAVHCSAKTGLNVRAILEEIVKRVPPPAPATGGPLKALIFDSYYDPYKGVVVFFRVVDGEVRKGDRVRFLFSGKDYEATEVGVMSPKQRPIDVLQAGEVGYLAGAIKSVEDARVGDTITLSKGFEQVKPLPGYSEAVPMVYCGLFPTEGDEYEALREALGKLRLNDAALSYEPESSSAMGFGFRCGFLGLLHMEIVQERLEREYDLDLIVTAPSVVYKVIDTKDEEILIDTPSKMPDQQKRKATLEPYTKLEIITPTEYVGTLMELCQNRRGELVDIKYLTPTRSTLIYEVPLAEVITDFFDQMKGRSKGYASMEYSLIGYRENDLVKLDIAINDEIAPPLSTIVHREKANAVGRQLCEKLKELIPRQMFRVPIQARIGVKGVATAVISPMRKDVLAKCYGGDISRKKKLLQKQAKGKKRMKNMGSVNVPQEAFMAVLNLNKD